MLWVKRLCDHVIQDLLGHPDLEFAWGDLKPADPAEQAKVIDIYVRDGIYAVNEARALLGLDPVPGGDTPMIYGAQGAVPLGDTAKAAGASSLRKYNPDVEAEPRIPKDETGGGQWTSGGSGGSATSSDAEEGPSTPIQIAEDQTCQDFISANCIGSIMRKFPGQFLDVPLADVFAAAKQGDRDAQTARKLLTNKDYRK
jgi:hypothetical protein